MASHVVTFGQTSMVSGSGRLVVSNEPIFQNTAANPSFRANSDPVPVPVPPPEPATLPGNPVFDLGNNTMAPWGGNSKFNGYFPDGRWIWATEKANESAQSSRGYRLGTTIYVDAACVATVHVIVDNTANVFLNGNAVGPNCVGGWGENPNYTHFDVTLATGNNILVILAVNGAANGRGPNPAGLLAGVRRKDNGAVLTNTNLSWRVVP
jgi:hypothetical protein